MTYLRLWSTQPAELLYFFKNSFFVLRETKKSILLCFVFLILIAFDLTYFLVGNNYRNALNTNWSWFNKTNINERIEIVFILGFSTYIYKPLCKN